MSGLDKVSGSPINGARTLPSAASQSSNNSGDVLQPPIPPKNSANVTFADPIATGTVTSSSSTKKRSQINGLSSHKSKQSSRVLPPLPSLELAATPSTVVPPKNEGDIPCEDDTSVKEPMCRTYLPPRCFWEAQQAGEHLDLQLHIGAPNRPDQPPVILHAHRLVLSARSPEFHRLLVTLPMNNPNFKNPPGRVDVQDIDAENFRPVLRYIYTAECADLWASIDKMCWGLYAARRLKMEDLSAVCRWALDQRLNSGDVADALRIIQLKRVLGPEEIEFFWSAIRVVRDHLETGILPDIRLINSIPFDVMCRLLKKMINIDELLLFRLLDIWTVEACRRKDKELTGAEKQSVAGKLVYHIRYTKISHEHILSVVRQSELLSEKQMFDIMGFQYDKTIQLPFVSTARADDVPKLAKKIRYASVIGETVPAAKVPTSPGIPCGDGNQNLVTSTMEHGKEVWLFRAWKSGTNEGCRLGVIQNWFVPRDGQYKICCGGAKGGDCWLSSSAAPVALGGRGSLVQVKLDMQSGRKYLLVVGHSGGNAKQPSKSDASTVFGAGGGGGSFLYGMRLDEDKRNSFFVKVAAGGGGGAAITGSPAFGIPGRPGVGTRNGTDSLSGLEGACCCRGGRDGDPGDGFTELEDGCKPSSANSGGPGAGWRGSGAKRPDCYKGDGGHDSDDFFLGGMAGYDMLEAAGGFGGGGGGSYPDGGAGGGGGYSGGAGGLVGQSGGGGGSRFELGGEGLDGGNTESVDGFIRITYMGPPSKSFAQ